MNPGATLLVYHGCDITTRDDLVSGRLTHLSSSSNRYDWLGPGAYFFEGDLDRALIFSHAAHAHPEKRYTAKPIATPAAVGAILQLQYWLDMTTQAGLREFFLAHEALVRHLTATATTIPFNRPATADDNDMIYRALDNAVFEYAEAKGKLSAATDANKKPRLRVAPR